ncbi:MAG: hypothetical protein M5R40_20450 [Anaerolineae bacterium]|nr:hypothetical protein [Anaerolineae bacterium]
MDTTAAHVIALAFMVSGGAVVAIVAVAVAAGGVFALGLAAARRCFLHLHEPIYPHLYVLWVAHSSIYKKTTGLAAIADLVRRVMPHMLLPEEMSPESFVNSLAGGKPENFDSLPPSSSRSSPRVGASPASAASCSTRPPRSSAPRARTTCRGRTR